MNKLTQWLIIGLLIILIVVMIKIDNTLRIISHRTLEIHTTLTQSIKSELVNQQQTLGLIEGNVWELKDVLLDDFSYYMKKLTN